MLSSVLIVANWKMQLSYNKSVAYIQTYRDDLRTLANSHSIVICPSFDALTTISMLLKDTPISLGAQNVSGHSFGAYTGQVSALSLQEVGCTYCIVGHSELRQYNNESNEQITQKLLQLSLAKITPIICVGETAAQYHAGETQNIICAQLEAIKNASQYSTFDTIYIAYEPVWAIGTGKTPTTEHISMIFSTINNYLNSNKTLYKLMYGGSINPENIESYCAIEKISGFLVGGASTDFQKFKKIVSLINKAR